MPGWLCLKEHSGVFYTYIYCTLINIASDANEVVNSRTHPHTHLSRIVCFVKKIVNAFSFDGGWNGITSTTEKLPVIISNSPPVF